ncbi:MAG TPA: P-II family nitrogen regulator [Candidatus Lokiarchaeia archaeon]|nr:P-II family nitrogen regulator [Candidatus Lokiarchaeia archaeon]
MIEAYIRPERLQAVKDALEVMGIKGMSISQVKGHGAQGGIKLAGRAGSYNVEFIDKVKLEICVDGDTDLEAIINHIADAARTGKPGDGKIFVLPIDDAIRIRTMERGESVC